MLGSTVLKASMSGLSEGGTRSAMTAEMVLKTRSKAASICSESPAGSRSPDLSDEASLVSSACISASTSARPKAPELPLMLWAWRATFCSAALR